MASQSELIGKVIRVFAVRPTWTSGVIEEEDSTGGLFSIKATHKFTAPLALTEGAEVCLRGSHQNGKFGWQFVATSAQVLDEDAETDPFSAEVLVSYLSQNKDLKHLGPARARKLVEEFGGVDGISEALLKHPEKVSEKISGLTLDRVISLARGWSTNFFLHKYRAQLMSYGLKEWQARRAIEKLGPTAHEVIQRNPWELYLALPWIGFDAVDTIARNALDSFRHDHPNRLHAMEFKRALEAEKSGHVWVSCSEAIAEKCEQTDPDEKYLSIVSLKGRTVVCRADLARAELDVLDPFFGAMKQPPRFWRDRPKPAPPQDLTAGQVEAFEALLSCSGLFVTGGAGTGKTFLAAAVADAVEDAQGEVMLCAPTGKAAKRLTESTGRVAFTIHRLLGVVDESTPLEALKKVDADLLIVDEISMCDSRLFALLAGCVDLERTSVLFMGDANQLPPVSPGNPLRDVLASKLAPIVELTQVLRQQGDLKHCCLEVLNGRVSATVHGVWEVHEGFTGKRIVGKLHDVLDGLEEEGYDLGEHVQVLTPMHLGATGTVEINRELVERYLPDAERDDRLRVGARVIQTRNDYKRNVFNGEIGEVIALASTAYTVLFDGGRSIVYEFDEKDDYGKLLNPHGNLELAYALTIHKAQGSEYPVVVVLLDNPNLHMLHRNLLYTAVTRARRRSILIGTRSAIRTAARTLEVDKRRTLLQVTKPV